MILLVFASCDDKKTNKPTTQQVSAKKEIKIPDFNADSAYNYVKKQVEFGPRVPGSEAHARCAEWFVDFFNEKADTVYVQEFSVLTGIHAHSPTTTLTRKTGTPLSTEPMTVQAA